MYFIDFVKNIIAKKNYGLFVWLILNTIIVTFILGAGFDGGVAGYILGAVAYIIIIIISLSPLGEWILRFQNGCKEITRREHVERLTPLFNEVYAKSKAENPELCENVQLYMVDEDEPNAFATGRRTICVTRGLLRYNDEQIKAVLAHEFGHLAHKDTDAILVISIGNLLVTVVFVVVRAIFKVLAFIGSIFAGMASESFAEALVSGFMAGLTAIVVDGILCGAMYLWTKLGALLCLHSSRQNENFADKYAFDLGYGEYLCAFLDSLGPSNIKGLWATLNSTHPDNDARIGYLQDLGCAYRSY